MRGSGCVLSWTTTGAMTGRVLRLKGAGEGVWYASLIFHNVV